MMVKDAQALSGWQGQLGILQFGHKPPPYEKTSMVHSFAQCESCHIKLAPTRIM